MIRNAIDSIDFYNDSLYHRLSRHCYTDIRQKKEFNRDKNGIYYTIIPEDHYALKKVDSNIIQSITHVKAYYQRYKFDKKGGVNDFVLEVWTFKDDFEIDLDFFKFQFKVRYFNYPNKILYSTHNTIYLVHGRSVYDAGLLNLQNVLIMNSRLIVIPLNNENV